MHRARPTTQRRFQWSAPSLPTSSGARLKNQTRSEEHTSELQSQPNLVCRLLLEKKKVYMRKITICAIAGLLSIASVHAAPQGNDVHTAATTLGVANIKTLQFQGSGTQLLVGHHY